MKQSILTTYVLRVLALFSVLIGFLVWSTVDISHRNLPLSIICVPVSSLQTNHIRSGTPPSEQTDRSRKKKTLFLLCTIQYLTAPHHRWSEVCTTRPQRSTSNLRSQIQEATTWYSTSILIQRWGRQRRASCWH